MKSKRYSKPLPPQDILSYIRTWLGQSPAHWASRPRRNCVWEPLTIFLCSSGELFLFSRSQRFHLAFSESVLAIRKWKSPLACYYSSLLIVCNKLALRGIMCLPVLLTAINMMDIVSKTCTALTGMMDLIHIIRHLVPLLAKIISTQETFSETLPLKPMSVWFDNYWTST